MKRKIAAILAADIAGYSRLVAEDEEETLRRLGTCRAVFSDFVARYGGRIFNTAGDATLAEFQSAVDAIRCAVDVQESIRTRNLAYPSSRHMSFRIGITIGDVVERDGDLLGDGVNIASRLESFAPAGGMCISSSVHDAVTKKISLKFDDLGLLQLKNIPDRVHAYTVALDQPTKSRAASLRAWRAIEIVTIAALGIGVYVFAQSILPALTSSGVGLTSPPTPAVEHDKTALSQAQTDSPSASPSNARESKSASEEADRKTSADTKLAAPARTDETRPAAATTAGPTVTPAPEQSPSTAPEQKEGADKEGDSCRRYLPSVGKTVEVPCERAQDRAEEPEKTGEAAAKFQSSVFTGQWAQDLKACAATYSSDESVRFVPGGFSIHPYICTQGDMRPLGSATEMDGRCQASEPGVSSAAIEIVRLTIEGDRLSVSGDRIRVSGYVRCGPSTANANEPRPEAIAVLPPSAQPQPSTLPANQESEPFKRSGESYEPQPDAQTKFSAEQLARKYGPLVKEGRQWYLRKGLAVIGVGYKELGGLKDNYNDHRGTSLDECKEACATDQPRCQAFHWGGGVGVVPICHLFDSQDLDTITGSVGTVGFKQ